MNKKSFKTGTAFNLSYNLILMLKSFVDFEDKINLFTQEGSLV